MVDAFAGTWKLVESKNFDDYMKSIGERTRDAGLERRWPRAQPGAALRSWLLPCTPAASQLVKVGVWGDAEKVAAWITACEACWDGTFMV